jgi:hypothetical protein
MENNNFKQKRNQKLVPIAMTTQIPFRREDWTDKLASEMKTVFDLDGRLRVIFRDDATFTFGDCVEENLQYLQDMREYIET